MRIAQIAPLLVAVPPKAYGGTERVVAELTDTLVQLGHEVTLFASGDSQTRARLVPWVPTALGFDPAAEVLATHLGLLTAAYRRAHEFDVIHSHLEHLTLPFTRWTKTPTVLTFHGRLDRPAAAQLLGAYPDAHYVSISDSQRGPVPTVRWTATVYHGVPVQSYPFSRAPGSYLLFLGRISPEKRPDRAIAIAKRAGVPLKIVGKIDAHDRTYFAQSIQPHLHDPAIEFVESVDEAQKRVLLRDAAALLLPIDWPEPFGLVFIEALACGTPVLTCPCGAAPELLADGETGYLRATDEELTAAVHALSMIDRAGCRSYAQRRFDTRSMADSYLRVYTQLLARDPLQA
jgi:glycosyltransferase involved in cell wall biosynthesis